MRTNRAPARRILLPAAFIAALMVALAGCAGTTPYRSPFGAALPGDEVDEALRYHQQVRKLPAAELTREYEQAGQAFAQSKDELARIRLALLLSAPNAPFRDDGAALNLLREWLKDAKPPHTGLRALGMMLATTIEEMRDRDKRAEALQKKLDALKTMEKNLLDREKR